MGLGGYPRITIQQSIKTLTAQYRVVVYLIKKIKRIQNILLFFCCTDGFPIISSGLQTDNLTYNFLRSKRIFMFFFSIEPKATNTLSHYLLDFTPNLDEITNEFQKLFVRTTNSILVSFFMYTTGGQRTQYLLILYECKLNIFPRFHNGKYYFLNIPSFRVY